MDAPAQGTAVVYVVATPIGNLEDLTPRARRTLAGVDIIAAEDTRHARKLLGHLAIHNKQLVSYQDHGESERAEKLIHRLLGSGESLALITDAGTPCVSDPGYRLVAAAHAAGLKVHPVPGVSAPTTLVSASGLPSDRILFIGFLPVKSSALAAELASWKGSKASIVFFESARRIARTLTSIAQLYPEAKIAIGRELTKLYEEIVSTDMTGALHWVAGHPTLKGEVSVMISPGRGVGEDDKVAEDELLEQARRGFRAGESLKDLLRKFQDSGYKRPELYQLLLIAKADL